MTGGGSRGGRGLWRLAWRGARAEPLRHLLIVALIALAVAGAVATTIGVRTLEITREERVRAQSGQAELTVSRTTLGPTYDELSAEAQAEVDERLGGPLPGTGEAEVEDALDAELPADAEVARVTSGFVPSEWGGIELRATDPSAPVLAGTLAGDVDRAPRSGEVLVSPGLLELAEAEVGDRIDLGEVGRLEVIGVAADPLDRSRPLAVIAPEEADALPGTIEQQWLIDGLGEDAPEGRPGIAQTPPTGMPPVDTDGPVAAALRERLDVPQRGAGQPQLEASVSVGSPGPPGYALSGIFDRPEVMGSLVGTVLLVQVGFIAAAAFATGARRRVRQFGLLAASGGADPRHLRGLVRREALVLGTLGATLGAGLGVAALQLGRGLLERLEGRPLEVQVAAQDVALPVVLGVVAALIAAWSPARTVARVPTAAALAGRVPRRGVPRWVAPASIVATATGALLLGVLLGTRIPGAAALRMGGLSGDLWRLAMLVSVALLLLGVAGLTVPLVAAGGRLAGRLPALLRLPVRDSARQRTRSAAAASATMVVLVVPVLVVTMVHTGAAARGPSRPPSDLAVITGPRYAGITLSASDADVAAARAALPVADGETVVPTWASESRSGLAIEVGDRAGGSTTIGLFTVAAAATPEVLRLAGLDELDAGTVVIEPTGTGLPDEDHVTIRDAFADRERTVEVITPSRSLRLSPLDLIVPDAIADELDLEPGADARVLELSRAPTRDEVEDAREVVSATGATVSVVGPASADTTTPRWVAIVVGGAALVAVLIALAAGALAATESDRDLRAMTAVGADPRTRPRFRGVQNGYHALVASILAVPTGLLLAALLHGRSGPYAGGGLDVPWSWLVLGLLAVPVVIGAVSWVASRPAPVGAPGRRVT